MKVILDPGRTLTRGAEPAIGNVYQHPHGRPFFKIVVGLVPSTEKWNGVIMVHVDAKGAVVGASCQPHNYVKNHHNLVGTIEKMPTLKVEFTKG